MPQNTSVPFRKCKGKGSAGRTVVCLFAGLVFAPVSGSAQDLPPEIARDMYIMQLAETLKAKDFTASLRNIERLRDLKIELPETISYFEGVASCETRNYERCRKSLTAYVTAVGSTGRYYQRALPLLAKAIEGEENPSYVDATDNGKVSNPPQSSGEAGRKQGVLIRSGYCAIIVGSRKTFAEARQFIRDYPRQPPRWSLYQTPNGWIALSPSTILNEDTTAQLQVLKNKGDIPEDAFCTPGKSFIAQIDARSGETIMNASGL